MSMDNRGWFPDQIAIELCDIPLESIAVVGPGLRAIVLVNGQWTQVTDVMRGTGIKPLVLVDGQYKLRTSNEGIPVVLDAGNLRTLAAGETLIQ